MSRLDVASPEVLNAGSKKCITGPELLVAGLSSGQEERERDPPPRQLVELPRFEQAIEGLGLYPGS